MWEFTGENPEAWGNPSRREDSLVRDYVANEPLIDRNGRLILFEFAIQRCAADSQHFSCECLVPMRLLKHSQNRHAFHDVGQAAATLALQATALGFQAHQMAGILPDKAREIFGIPPDYEAVAGFAIGYPGDPMTLPEGRLRDNETGQRQRKPVSSFVFTGKWGNVSAIVK